MLLFDLHVETSDSKIRELVCDNGARVAPEPPFEPRAARLNAIPEVFGHEIAAAIAPSPLRKAEVVERGGDLTDCVLMAITSSVDDEVFLELSLGLAEGQLLRSKLFGAAKD